jgi:hypothetical protein
MKKLLTILGLVFLFIIVLIAVGISIAVVKGLALDKESKAYVDRSLPLIISQWDEAELLSRASPEFMQSTKRKELDKYFAVLSKKFGKMQSYEGSDGQSYVNYQVLSSRNGKVVTAIYTVKVVFDAGPAAIKVTLIKHSDLWQIEGFNINSDVLIQH